MLAGIRVGVMVLAFAAAMPAVTIGVADTFSDGTTMGWHVGGASPAQPANVSTGGPGGAGDAYLQLMSIGGGGPGSRLSVLNDVQWAGDYLATGVYSIAMDVNNLGPDELSLRLLFEAFPDGGGAPTDVALTANAVVVPAGSGWRRISFEVNPWNLVSAGLGTPLGALSAVDVVRIFHNPAPAFPGPGVGIPVVTATLGVDNIVAAVPEPGTVSMVLAGSLLVFAVRRRRIG